jgi:hypothetical protein
MSTKTDHFFTDRNQYDRWINREIEGTMSTKLIKLEDSTLVEVEVPESEAQQISGGLADKVDATFSKIKPVLLKVCQPVASAVREIRDEVDLEEVEIELGLSFESEGNIYITKAKLGANVVIRMTLKNK